MVLNDVVCWIFDDYVEMLKFMYKMWCDVMLLVFEVEMFDSVMWIWFEGGMFVWLILLLYIDVGELLV